MRIHIFDNAQQVALATANLFAAQILQKPNSVLGLATGSSPVESYQNLVDFYNKGFVDFSKVTTFNLDEYVSIPHDHPASYHDFMDKALFNLVNINKTNVYIPDGNGTDLEAICKEYDELILNAGGIDLQLLGIGNNAHIGFNEPDDHFTYGCHVVKLTPSTIEANTRFFDDASQVPKEAVSLGVGAIMQAKKVVLIAMGNGKAQAIYDAIHGNIDPKVPASILRAHQDVTFLLDKEAASLL